MPVVATQFNFDVGARGVTFGFVALAASAYRGNLAEAPTVLAASPTVGYDTHPVTHAETRCRRTPGHIFTGPLGHRG